MLLLRSMLTQPGNVLVRVRRGSEPTYLDIFVCLHDLFDTSQRQMMQLVVLRDVFNFMHLVHPKGLQHVRVNCMHRLLLRKGWIVVMLQRRRRRYLAHGRHVVLWRGLLLRLLVKMSLVLVVLCSSWGIVGRSARGLSLMCHSSSIAVSHRRRFR